FCHTYRTPRHPPSFPTRRSSDLMKRWFLSCVIATVAATAQTIPDNVVLDKDVVYIQGGRIMMDVARPKAPGAYPAVIAIHGGGRSEEHTSELQSLTNLVSRLLLS